MLVRFVRKEGERVEDHSREELVSRRNENFPRTALRDKLARKSRRIARSFPRQFSAQGTLLLCYSCGPKVAFLRGGISLSLSHDVNALCELSYGHSRIDAVIKNLLTSEYSAGRGWRGWCSRNDNNVMENLSTTLARRACT